MTGWDLGYSWWGGKGYVVVVGGAVVFQCYWGWVVGDTQDAFLVVPFASWCLGV